MKMLTLVLLVYTTFRLFAQSDCPTQTFYGTGTFYIGAGTAPGACNIPINENLAYICAMNEAQYNSAAYCGACIEVTGALGTEIVLVTDLYPGAQSGDLDFNQSAFEAIIGNASLGTGTISWKVVSCPLASFPLELTMNPSANPWWHSFYIHRHVNPIATVEEWVNGAWVSMTRQPSNSWEFSPSNVTMTDVRVTDMFGEQIIIPNVDLTNSTASFFATSNFTACLTQASLNEFDVADFHVLVGPSFVEVESEKMFYEIRVKDMKGSGLRGYHREENVNKLQVLTDGLSAGSYLLEILDETGKILGSSVFVIN